MLSFPPRDDSDDKLELSQDERGMVSSGEGLGYRDISIRTHRRLATSDQTAILEKRANASYLDPRSISSFGFCSPANQ